MHLNAWDKKDAPAQITICGIVCNVVPNGVHDKGGATEFVEGEEARPRGRAHHRQRRLSYLRSAATGQHAADFGQQGVEKGGVANEVGRGTSPDLISSAGVAIRPLKMGLYVGRPV